MTRVISFTKANIKRRIKAAREAGLLVTGIAVDGTLIVGDRPGEPVMDAREKAPAASWDDA
jgi:hypothetical protein